MKGPTINKTTLGKKTKLKVFYTLKYKTQTHKASGRKVIFL